MAGDELTPSEVAAELGVSPATVRRWEKRGVLTPSRRLPGEHGHRRYSRSAVDALKKKFAPKPESDSD
ncbi:helix-turn-helix domain-containing protein [Micromonospora sp. NPDC053740]|uniref:helix-turn-helix domain-containing protein n=1 Tax=Micromonospora sp. NPDC053740 TaxID=3155173 RepID=UPI00343564C5